jgi:hypothetical protein
LHEQIGDVIAILEHAYQLGARLLDLNDDFGNFRVEMGL